MPHARSFPFYTIGLVTLTTGIMAFPVPVQAGFEFKPSPVMEMPVPMPTDSAVSPVPVLPPPAVESTTLVAPPPASVEPVPVQMQAPVPRPPEPEAMPVMESAPAMVDNTIKEAPPSPPSVPSQYPDAVGFGDKIPLALALRGIVPPQYAYSFDPAVDQGALISWNGGKPWNVALADALRPLNLGTRISGSTVEIFPGSQPVMESRSMGEAIVWNEAVPSAPASSPYVAVEMGKPASPGSRGSTMVPPPGSISSAPPVSSQTPVYIRRNETRAHEDSLSPHTSRQQTGREVYIRRSETQSRRDDSADGKSPSFWSRMRPEFFTDIENMFSSGEELAEPVATPVVAKKAVAPAASIAPASSVASSLEPSAPAMPVALAQEDRVVFSPPAEEKPALQKKEVLDPYAVQSWEAAKGESLKQVLNKWSDDAGVRVEWKTTQDYVLPGPIKVEGSYTEALTSILTSYSGNGPRPSGQLHANLPEGPSVLIIESSGS